MALLILDAFPGGPKAHLQGAVARLHGRPQPVHVAHILGVRGDGILGAPQRRLLNHPTTPNDAATR